MFGRRLKLTFFRTNTTVQDTVVIEANTLHGLRGYVVKGNVTMQGFAQIPTCELDIYNLSASEILQITNLAYSKNAKGETVANPIGLQIDAGYADGDFDIIFRGKVLRPTSQRPEPQTSSLHIYAVECQELVANEALSQRNFTGGVNWYSVAQSIVEEGLANNPDYKDNFVVQLSESLRKQQVEQQYVCDGGTLYKGLSEIATNTNTELLLNRNGVTLGTWQEIMQGKANQLIELSPTTGLVGIPTLSTDGITCECLLNPKVDVFTSIKLDNTTINNDITDPTNAGDIIGVGLASDGIYFVLEYAHNFDTSVGAFQTTMRCLSVEMMQYQLGG